MIDVWIIDVLLYYGLFICVSSVPVWNWILFCLPLNILTKKHTTKCSVVCVSSSIPLCTSTQFLVYTHCISKVKYLFCTSWLQKRKPGSTQSETPFTYTLLQMDTRAKWETQKCRHLKKVIRKKNRRFATWDHWRWEPELGTFTSKVQGYPLIKWRSEWHQQKCLPLPNNKENIPHRVPMLYFTGVIHPFCSDNVWHALVLTVAIQTELNTEAGALSTHEQFHAHLYTNTMKCDQYKHIQGFSDFTDSITKCNVTDNHNSLQDWAHKKDNSRFYWLYIQWPTTLTIFYVQ